MSSVFTCNYSFHGLGLTVCGDDVVSASLRARLGQFPENNSDQDQVRFGFYLPPDPEHHRVRKPLGAGRSVYEHPAGEFLYFDHENQLYIECGNRVRVLCEPGPGRVQFSIDQSQIDSVRLATHLLFTISLAELLKQRRRYSLHAAGLGSDGKALLIAGPSGAGKSTLALALLKAGFCFLGDDMIFLVPDPEGVRVLAFPEEIDITDETAALFPELRHLLPRPKTSRCPKYQVCAEAVFGISPTWECRPSVLVFPSITKLAKSILKPMRQDEALLELAPNILLTEARSSQAHLEVLGKLVEESACYRLETGRDFDAIPMLMRELMK